MAHGVAQLGVGGTALSAHVFHPDRTICQHKSCSKKKMNCMYSSNSRHLILACLAAIQLVVSTEIHIGAHHFQKIPEGFCVLTAVSTAAWGLNQTLSLCCPQLEEFCQVQSPHLHLSTPQSTSSALLWAQVSWQTAAPTAISGCQHVGCAA